ncbi:MAG: acyltransferase, partial [Myxococcota bacterium]
MKSTYRPDIDGLRALAVLLVILFHLDPERVPGGYIGVDVFFVISGYLITQRILAHREAGTWSLLGFYAGR